MQQNDAIHLNIYRRVGVEVERSSRMLEIGVRSPVAKDLNEKTGSDSSTAKRSAKGVCHGSSEINGRPVSQLVWLV